MRRVLAIVFGFSASVLVGADTYAAYNLERCGVITAEAIAKQNAEILRYSEYPRKRNDSLRSWLKTATYDEISKVWGLPESYDGELSWIIPLQPIQTPGSVYVTDKGETCFSIPTSRIGIEVKQASKDDIQSRTFRNVVSLKN